MFNYDLLDLNGDIEIIKIGEKVVYNTDTLNQASEWVKEEIKGVKTFDAPQLSTGLNLKNKGVGRVINNAIGYFYSHSNNVMKNANNVGLFTSAFSGGHGLSVTPENFLKCVSFFTARRVIELKWDNLYDEYLKPKEDTEEYVKYSYDSVVYSLFHDKSQQSSLRQIEYKDKLWDIKNEFFWMSADRMKELADENGYDELYNDARTASDRHVYKLLFGEERIYDKLSDDAKAVLDKATELVEQSMELRQVMANEHNHLDSWDAGYAQLKLVWKEYFTEDFKEFRDLYKSLEDRMRPLVYELGFLMK